MAKSPVHRFGQIIGDLLEAAVESLLAPFVNKHGLYLDKKGKRPCRAGKKCTWIDLYKNAHDLDFVLERGGTPDNVGVPVAFIETAWRRYTRHSRNKAQEIQGAILPLVQTYKNAGPFVGVVLGGVFTSGAVNQLQSLGFQCLYIPFESIIAVLSAYGIDAEFDDDTPDREVRRKIKQYEALSAVQRATLVKGLLGLHKAEVNSFMQSLERAVLRQIESIIILPLHGSSAEYRTVSDAIAFVQAYNETSGSGAIQCYEIQIRYNNGNEIRGRFIDKHTAVEFLQTFLPPTVPLSGRK